MTWPEEEIQKGANKRQIEEQAKIVNYIAGRKIGLSADAASDLVHKTLFNYDDLTAFERHWLRRAFPFYTWSSKNATELQPFLLKERPLQYLALTKLMDAAENSFSRGEDVNMLQDHLRYRAVYSAGLGRLIAGFGLPQEDLVQLFQTAEIGSSGIRYPSGLVSRTHPIVPFLTKFVFGRDPYYNVDVVKIRSARDLRYLPEFIKRWAGYAEIDSSYTDSDGVTHNTTRYETGWFPNVASKKAGLSWEDSVMEEDREVGSNRLMALRSIPPWRLAAEWSKVMTDTFMGGVAAESGAKARWRDRIPAVLTGTKPYAINWDTLEYYAHRNFDERLGDIVKNKGNMGEIDVFYKERRRPAREIQFLRENQMIGEEDLVKKRGR